MADFKKTSYWYDQKKKSEKLKNLYIEYQNDGELGGFIFALFLFWLKASLSVLN